MTFGLLQSDLIPKARAMAKAANLKIKQTVAKPKPIASAASSLKEDVPLEVEAFTPFGGSSIPMIASSHDSVRRKGSCKTKLPSRPLVKDTSGGDESNS